jgi:hypothetical protein
MDVTSPSKFAQHQHNGPQCESLMEKVAVVDRYCVSAIERIKLFQLPRFPAGIEVLHLKNSPSRDRAESTLSAHDIIDSTTMQITEELALREKSGIPDDLFAYYNDAFKW